MSADSSHELVYPSPDPSVPQMTVRAILTGMALGAVLSLCNIYAGLKIGWGFNMSVTAALLSYGFWSVARAGLGTRPWNILENNINQTAASAAASISSAGLVAPIPALTLLTGEELSYPLLALWVLVVALLGVFVAVAVRRQMLLVDALPFPNGIATGETLREMYARGREAVAKVLVLLAAAFAASTVKVVATVAALSHVVLPGGFAPAAGGALASRGVSVVSMKNLGFTLEPSLLFLGVGAIIGLRAGLSMLLGAVLAWLVLGPMVLDSGWVSPTKPDPEAAWYGDLIKWMLWPGVAIMVASSLTSFAFSWRSLAAAFRGARSRSGTRAVDPYELSRSAFWRLVLVVTLAAVVLQALLFGIHLAVGLLGVALTVVLAVVAARVSGETGITPVGPLGKVTQLTFGVLTPGDVSANLMTANVTAGAASQCADLLHDMKTGLLIGASPRLQAIAQMFGVLAGALAGSAAYLILIPDPATMLLTDEWPATAVAQWKSVAELFRDGLDTMPAGASAAMAWGAALGVSLAIAERTLPGRWRRLVPSPAALGLAAAIPAYYSLSMFMGGLIAFVASRVAKRWSTRFLIVAASGLVAGDSLTGVAVAIEKIVAGG